MAHAINTFRYEIYGDLSINRVFCVNDHARHELIVMSPTDREGMQEFVLHL